MATAFPPREGLSVSISQIKQYIRCSRAYELKYVRGEPPAFTVLALAFGSSFHSALASYYGGIKLFGQPASLEEMQDAFRDEWEKFLVAPVPVHVGDDDEDGKLEAQVDKAMQMLEVFREQAELRPRPTVHAIEQGFTIDLYDPDTGEVLEERLTGFMDVVLGPDGGLYTVVENKSAARKYDANTLRWDFQVTAYQMGARALGLGAPELAYQVCTKTKKPALQYELVRRDEQDEADFVRLAVATLKSIDAGAFAPLRSWACATCPYQNACNSRRR